MNDNKKQLTKMRRRDCNKDDQWIVDFVKQSPFGTLATAIDNQPFLNTNTFVYDENKHAIYLHTYRSGRTKENVESNPKVCYTIAEMGRLLPADSAKEMSVEFSSVVIFGRAYLVRESGEAREALTALLEKYFPHLKVGEDYSDTTADDLVQTAVYRIDIDQWSGKQRTAEPGCKDAFFYGEQKKTDR